MREFKRDISEYIIDIDNIDIDFVKGYDEEENKKISLMFIGDEGSFCVEKNNVQYLVNFLAKSDKERESVFDIIDIFIDNSFKIVKNGEWDKDKQDENFSRQIDLNEPDTVANLIFDIEEEQAPSLVS